MAQPTQISGQCEQVCASRLGLEQTLKYGGRGLTHDCKRLKKTIVILAHHAL